METTEQAISKFQKVRNHFLQNDTLTDTQAKHQLGIGATTIKNYIYKLRDNGWHIKTERKKPTVHTNNIFNHRVRRPAQNVHTVIKRGR